MNMLWKTCGSIVVCLFVATHGVAGASDPAIGHEVNPAVTDIAAAELVERLLYPEFSDAALKQLPLASLAGDQTYGVYSQYVRHRTNVPPSLLFLRCLSLNYFAYFPQMVPNCFANTPTAEGLKTAFPKILAYHDKNDCILVHRQVGLLANLLGLYMGGIGKELVEAPGTGDSVRIQLIRIGERGIDWLPILNERVMWENKVNEATRTIPVSTMEIDPEPYLKSLEGSSVAYRFAVASLLSGKPYFSAVPVWDELTRDNNPILIQCKNRAQVVAQWKQMEKAASEAQVDFLLQVDDDVTAEKLFHLFNGREVPISEESLGLWIKKMPWRADNLHWMEFATSYMSGVRHRTKRWENGTDYAGIFRQCLGMAQNEQLDKYSRCAGMVAMINMLPQPYGGVTPTYGAIQPDFEAALWQLARGEDYELSILSFMVLAKWSPSKEMLAQLQQLVNAQKDVLFRKFSIASAFAVRVKYEAVTPGAFVPKIGHI